MVDGSLDGSVDVSCLDSNSPARCMAGAGGAGRGGSYSAHRTRMLLARFSCIGGGPHGAWTRRSSSQLCMKCGVKQHQGQVE